MNGNESIEEEKPKLQKQKTPRFEKVKECINGHPLKPIYHAKPRELNNGEFSMGEDIVCKVCNEKIVIEQGYFSCEDVCDFDAHLECTSIEISQAKISDNQLCCPKSHESFAKRQPGFVKKVELAGQE